VLKLIVSLYPIDSCNTLLNKSKAALYAVPIATFYIIAEDNYVKTSPFLMHSNLSAAVFSVPASI
jgi:hypothetical protein